MANVEPHVRISIQPTWTVVVDQLLGLIKYGPLPVIPGEAYAFVGPRLKKIGRSVVGLKDNFLGFVISLVDLNKRMENIITIYIKINGSISPKYLAISTFFSTCDSSSESLVFQMKYF